MKPIYPKRIPEGQPRPYPRVEIVPDKTTKRELVHFIYPHEVTNIRSKEDLELALKHYSNPFPMLDGSEHLQTTDSYRYIIQWVFPALRWFCKVYNKEVPGWLMGNGWADSLDDKEVKEYFGKDPVIVREWREDKQETRG
jgi:hypothetical protein